VRRIAIPEAAELLGIHPSEVRSLIEDGRLDAVQAGGRWLISPESLKRMDGDEAGPAEADLRRLEERIAALERRFDLVTRGDPGEGDLRPALQPLFRTTE
jgi:excisionase family DNA binding protein